MQYIYIHSDAYRFGDIFEPLSQGFLNLPACRHRSAFRILMSARKIVATFFKKLLQKFFLKKLPQKFEIASSIALTVAMFVATFLTIFIATFIVAMYQLFLKCSNIATFKKSVATIGTNFMNVATFGTSEKV